MGSQVPGSVVGRGSRSPDESSSRIDRPTCSDASSTVPVSSKRGSTCVGAGRLVTDMHFPPRGILSNNSLPNKVRKCNHPTDGPARVNPRPEDRRDQGTLEAPSDQGLEKVPSK